MADKLSFQKVQAITRPTRTERVLAQEQQQRQTTEQQLFQQEQQEIAEEERIVQERQNTEYQQRLAIQRDYELSLAEAYSMAYTGKGETIHGSYTKQIYNYLMGRDKLNLPSSVTDNVSSASVMQLGNLRQDVQGKWSMEQGYSEKKETRPPLTMSEQLKAVYEKVPAYEIVTTTSPEGKISKKRVEVPFTTQKLQSPDLVYVDGIAVVPSNPMVFLNEKTGTVIYKDEIGRERPATKEETNFYLTRPLPEEYEKYQQTLGNLMGTEQYKWEEQQQRNVSPMKEGGYGPFIGSIINIGGGMKQFGTNIWRSTGKQFKVNFKDILGNPIIVEKDASYEGYSEEKIKEINSAIEENWQYSEKVSKEAVEQPFPEKGMIINDWKSSPFIDLTPTTSDLFNRFSGLIVPPLSAVVNVKEALTQKPDYPLYEKYSRELRKDTKTPEPTIEELALKGGLAFTEATLLYTGIGAIEKVATKQTAKMVIRLASNVDDSLLKAVSKNLLSLGIVGAEKTATTFARAYFITSTVGTIAKMPSLAVEKRYPELKIAVVETGASFLGAGVGSTLGKGTVDLITMAKGKFLAIPLEYNKKSKEVMYKELPSNIQLQTLINEKGEVIAYRRGPYGNVKPKYDKYLHLGKLKNPTESIFFRYDEATGVGGKKIKAVLSVPAFVNKPSYLEMFRYNLKEFSNEKLLMKYIKAFAITPPAGDVLFVSKVKTTKIKVGRKAVTEASTKAELSKATQEKILMKNTLVSDKMREWAGTENELVLRTPYKQPKGSQIYWTYGLQGELIPVVAEPSLVDPYGSIFGKRAITPQDAKFIQRNLSMYKKYREKLVQPKEHATPHALNVLRNVNIILKLYPEYAKELGKEGVRQLRLASYLHDIGKPEEGSLALGTPHGQKVYDVWKSGDLKKMGVNLNREGASAIRVHETIDPRSISYKIKNFLGRVPLMDKILATGDRLDLPREGRYNIVVDPSRLPLSDFFEKVAKTEDKILFKKVKASKSLNLDVSDAFTTKTPTYYKVKEVLIKYPYAGRTYKSYSLSDYGIREYPTGRRTSPLAYQEYFPKEVKGYYPSTYERYDLPSERLTPPYYPSYITTEIPSFPRVSKPASPLTSDKLKKYLKVRKLKPIDIMALLPDFTARSIGLEPEEYSVKEALKEMKKIQTGFSIRRGGKIKGYKPIDEKSLLKDLMK